MLKRAKKKPGGRRQKTTVHPQQTLHEQRADNGSDEDIDLDTHPGPESADVSIPLLPDHDTEVEAPILPLPRCMYSLLLPHILFTEYCIVVTHKIMPSSLYSAIHCICESHARDYSYMAPTSTLIRYGGILERGSREITMDDFWSLALDKMDAYICLKPLTVDVTSEGNESSSDEEDGENDEDEDEDSEEDDVDNLEGDGAQEPVDTNDNGGEISDTDVRATHASISLPQG